jgi:hypothetical protein
LIYVGHWVMKREIGCGKIYGSLIGISIGLLGPIAALPGLTQASELPIAAALTLAPSGKLRVSNRSQHPIRLAMRLKAEKLRGDKYNEKVANPNRYEVPAHWDFYAGEGGDRGLIVALPNRSVHLSKGDVVMAFAQDGSRRYWGPLIVGETDNPIWNPATQEWNLVLED